MQSTDALTNVDRVVNSALWAAYGDALGFISEGVDERGLARRLSGRDFETHPWVRKVSRQSPDISLPAGLYSDDTQLRLATGRAIRSDGTFDVDYFAATELPAWLNYHLGAGLGTQASAKRLRSGIVWSALVRGDKDGRYVNGGGNGAVMRIQPHVWGARGQIDAYLKDVIHNTACTHGHPKAFAGSLFHAIMLHEVLTRKALPDIASVLRIVERVQRLSSILVESPIFGAAWISHWERSAASPFLKEWLGACDEIRSTVELIPRQTDPYARKGSYNAFLEKSGLLNEKERGVATKTAVAAFAAVWLHPDMPARQVLQLICSETGSDTDTIATLAGALLGAYRDDECNSAVLDRDYIASEATRIAMVGAGRDHPNAPSAAKTLPPTAATVRGFQAIASPTSDRMLLPTAKEGYQWARLSFGQTVLLRVPSGGNTESMTLFDAGGRHIEPAGRPKSSDQPARNPAAIAMTLANSGFDAQKIAKYLLSCAKLPHGEGLAASISYELVRLYRDRAGLAKSNATTAVVDQQSSEPKKKAVQKEPLHAALQLQLRAIKSDSGTLMSGSLSNYGRNVATDITVTVGSNVSSFGFELPVLEVASSQAIERTAHVPIDNGTPVNVSYRSDGLALRQNGRFELAVGQESTFLLKGLDLAKPA